MRKYFLLIMLLEILFGSLYADGYPQSREMNKVYIILKDGTGVQGYTDLLNWSYDHRPPVKAAAKGSDVLPIVLENYTAAESLWVDTVIVNYGGCDFGLLSGTRHFKVSDVKSIFALTDINAEVTNMISVNFEAYLTDAEYQLLLKSYTASLFADGSGLQDNLLLSCNPTFTQLDLYLYSCMMIKDQHDIRSHPFLDKKDSEAFIQDLQDFCFNKNTSKSSKMINILKKSKESWLTMAKYLQDSQAILPEERTNSIAKLNTLSRDCDVVIQTVTDLSNTNKFPTQQNDIEALYQKIYICVFPNLYFPTKDAENFDWYSYLIKKGIILKYFPWD